MHDEGFGERSGVLIVPSLNDRVSETFGGEGVKSRQSLRRLSHISGGDECEVEFSSEADDRSGIGGGVESFVVAVRELDVGPGVTH